MRKLLLYFSYLGTNYKGLQVLNGRVHFKGGIPVPVVDYDTVQGILEQGLKKILGYGHIALHVSSRTDTGVHALSSTVHLEIDDNAFSVVPFSPEGLCQSFNLYLEKNSTDIRIQKIVQVPLDFHCRRAYSRTYMYRIALMKTNDYDNCRSVNRLSAVLPITELYRAQVVPQPFDVTNVQQACRVFVGTWNFKSFCKTGNYSNSSFRETQESDFVKTIYRFSFSKTKVEDPDYFEFYTRDPTYNRFELYDFTIEGSGFVRRQVRRMVGILLGVGNGQVDKNFILWLLNNPSEKSWNGNTPSALSEGLYLKSVNYRTLDVLRGFIS